MLNNIIFMFDFIILVQSFQGYFDHRLNKMGNRANKCIADLITKKSSTARIDSINRENKHQEILSEYLRNILV